MASKREKENVWYLRQRRTPCYQSIWPR